MSKTSKTFKEYYQNPEFKEKHKKYMAEKITCKCGKTDIARYNMTKHKKIKQHIEWLEQNKTKLESNEKCIQQLNKLKLKIDKIISTLK